MAHLAKSPLLEGIVAFGSTGLPTQSADSDYDLFLVVEDWPASVRVGAATIDGRFTDLLFAQPAALDRILESGGPLGATSCWDGRLASSLHSGRVLFDRGGRLATVQRHLQAVDGPVVLPSETEAYRYWFRVNDNRLQTACCDPAISRTCW